MKKAISTYKRSTSWITVGLLTVVMLSFGIFAQYKVSDRPTPLVDGKSYFCDQVLDGWCDRLADSSTQPSNLITIIQ